MKLLTAIKRFFLKRKLDKATLNEDEDRLIPAVFKAAENPALVDLLTPDHVATAMMLLVENDEGGKFVAFGAALASARHKLTRVDGEDMLNGIHMAASDAHVGPQLLATIAAFESNNPNDRGRLASGLGSGVFALVASDDVYNEDIAQALATLANSPLMAKDIFAQAVLKGITYGIAELVEKDCAGTATDILQNLKAIAADDDIDINPLLPAFTAGVEQGMETLSFTHPQVARATIGYLNIRDAPELLAGITDRHAQITARNILRARDDEASVQDRDTFADMSAEIRNIPHLAFAIASMPESERLVTFTAGQTGSGYAMVVEATPRDGLRITTGCRVYETPQQRIEAWLAHTENSRRESTIPCVFEAVAKLTQSPYQHRAADARAELDVLAIRYNSEWAEKLPEIARTRIEKVLPAPAAT